MSSTPVSRAVRALIDEALRTVADLDVLLLLRSGNDRSWNPEAAGRALRTTPSSALERLEHLARKGLVRRDADGFRYDRDGHRDTTVSELERAFARYRARIVTMIYE